MLTLSYHAFCVIILLVSFLSFQGGWWKSERDLEKKQEQKWRDNQAKLPKAQRNGIKL